MTNLQKAQKLLSVDTFEPRRALAARRLYHESTGQEKKLIGMMFESQFALAPDPAAVRWLQGIDRYFQGKK